jgi:alcohol dehydrogenase (cytochrome c)
LDFPEPPTASLLSTAGGLLFVPDARGWLHALDVKTGKDSRRRCHPNADRSFRRTFHTVRAAATSSSRASSRRSAAPSPRARSRQGNDGAPHNGGIISYEAGGKQFIAVVTGGASLVLPPVQIRTFLAAHYVVAVANRHLGWPSVADQQTL